MGKCGPDGREGDGRPAHPRGQRPHQPAALRPARRSGPEVPVGMRIHPLSWVSMRFPLLGHGDHEGEPVAGGAAGNAVTRAAGLRVWRPRRPAGPGGAPDPPGRACDHETEGQRRLIFPRVLGARELLTR
jgi:hypothetical protein